MSETRGFDRWAPALALLALLALVGGLAFGVWGHRGDHHRAQQDVARELGVEAKLAEVGQYWHAHGALPPDEGARAYARLESVRYRALDRTRFQLGVRFDGARSPRQSGAMGPAFAHPAGLVWYAFDATGFGPPDRGLLPQPDAVDPPFEGQR